MNAKPSVVKPWALELIEGEAKRLDLTTIGVFALLLAEYWTDGPLLDNDRTLAFAARCTPDEWRLMRPMLVTRFVIVNGRWHHARIDHELDVAVKRQSKAPVAAEESAKKKRIAGLFDAEAEAEPAEVDATSSVAPCDTQSDTSSATPSDAPSTGNGHDQQEPKASVQAWRAYSASYMERYGEAPVRNAKTNRNMVDFVAKVPAKEAPHIASFYVWSNKQQYVANGHNTNQLVRDAEFLRTQWAKGQHMTDSEARMSDQRATTNAAFDRVIGAMDKGHRHG